MLRTGTGLSVTWSLPQGPQGHIGCLQCLAPLTYMHVCLCIDDEQKRPNSLSVINLLLWTWVHGQFFKTIVPAPYSLMW